MHRPSTIELHIDRLVLPAGMEVNAQELMQTLETALTPVLRSLSSQLHTDRQIGQWPTELELDAPVNGQSLGSSLASTLGTLVLQLAEGRRS